MPSPQSLGDPPTPSARRAAFPLRRLGPDPPQVVQQIVAASRQRREVYTDRQQPRVFQLFPLARHQTTPSPPDAVG